MAGTRQQSKSTPAAENWKYFFWGGLGIGFFLLILSVGIHLIDVNFPWSRLLVTCGVAALFSAIGSTAFVEAHPTDLGTTIKAGGAAAIAIALSVLIGRDPSPPPPAQDTFSMTYYINFPEGAVLPGLNDLRASVEIRKAGQSLPDEQTDVPLTHAPAGDSLRLTVHGVSSSDWILLRVSSVSDNRSWESALLPATESFMNLHPE